MIADQMKKKCSPECKEHYLDIWEELIFPEMLADKLEDFDNIRRSLPSGPRRYVKASEIVNDGRQVSFRKPERPPKREYSHQVTNERSPLRCYGCGKQGVIKSRCPTCNLNASQRTDVATNHINAYTAQTRSPRLTLIDITFCGIKGRDDNAPCHRAKVVQKWLEDHTVNRMNWPGQSPDLNPIESLWFKIGYEISKKKPSSKRELIEALIFSLNHIVTKDLLLKLVHSMPKRYVKNTCWYFWDNPTHKHPFGEELDTPSIVEKISSNTCQLREGKGGEATNILEHHINTGNSPPISVPPYRMSPVKNCPYTALNTNLQIRSLPGYYRHLCQPNVLKPWPLISSGPYLRVKMVKDGSSSLRIVPRSGSNCLHYPMPQLKNVAITLIEEVLLRYGIPRRLISDIETGLCQQ
ncbi:uncharacterized protein TNCV_1278911 [Trichonephila clavipes]|nr:uncharacterized protein TNCV_1278911 [Trichonephila clavipes]